MSFVSKIIGTAERVPLPDLVIRAAVQRLCSRTATRLAGREAVSDTLFADEMAARAIAGYTDEAKAPHHELPAAFFALVLGPNRKYSSCFYKEPKSTLQEAEEEALRQTVAHADLADGQSILELGCGWGPLSLWMARQFPKSEISAVSNSQSQREYIEREAAAPQDHPAIVAPTLDETERAVEARRRFEVARGQVGGSVIGHALAANGAAHA